jgi:hypothetical protein
VKLKLKVSAPAETGARHVATTVANDAISFVFMPTTP